MNTGALGENAPVRDPGLEHAGRISPQDLLVLKERFPMLCQFSDEFLQSRSMDELLRIESTSLRVKDAERNRENEDKLSQNKLGLDTKFYEVQAGRDNRWSDLHPRATCLERQQRRSASTRGRAKSWASLAPPPHWLL